MKKWQWFAALLLLGTVLVSERFGTVEVKRGIQRVVYSSEDLILMRSTLQNIFFRKDEQVTVSADPSISELLTFVSLDRYNDGFLFMYEEVMPIKALYDGLVVFTGHTKYNGKTISVLYDEGTTVTYGYIDQLSVLPYMGIAKGELLAVKEPGKLYIQIEKNGQIFNLEQTLQWLKQQEI